MGVTVVANNFMPTRFSFSLGNMHDANVVNLAARLKAAIDAGRVFEGIYIAVDDSGDEYVSWLGQNAFGATLDADLKKLGF